MKTETKHTPGPWYHEGTPQPVIASESDPKGRDIALVRLWDGDEAEANAHLIAAAPEMLEALEAVVANCGHLNWEQEKALIDARAAIAKAKGEGVAS